eukprot:NODE_8573_length_377_cov_1.692547.p2 GENE.NODE_8573_length_377_cov_1.692547~~NODE_8573_length_377_cov_1.692547.p2  ORF type:complete len:68 (+),score=3.29 NODE_8573_length_377_cov_1.692547:63-266(+)
MDVCLFCFFGGACSFLGLTVKVLQWLPLLRADVLCVRAASNMATQHHWNFIFSATLLSVCFAFLIAA